MDEQLQGIKIIGNGTSDGVECVVVFGNFSSGGESKVWVGLKDHLIGRIEERSKNGTREEARRPMSFGYSTVWVHVSEAIQYPVTQQQLWT